MHMLFNTAQGKDITVQELLDLIPKIHFGVTPQLLFKADVSEKDIEEKRAAPLAQVMPDIVPTAALKKLQSPDLSAHLRATFEKQGTYVGDPLFTRAAPTLARVFFPYFFFE